MFHKVQFDNQSRKLSIALALSGHGYDSEFINLFSCLLSMLTFWISS